MRDKFSEFSCSTSSVVNQPGITTRHSIYGVFLQVPFDNRWNHILSVSIERFHLTSRITCSYLPGVPDGHRSTGIMYMNDVCMAATPNV